MCPALLIGHFVLASDLARSHEWNWCCMDTPNEFDRCKSWRSLFANWYSYG